MSRACLITLVAFAVISCAAASRILEDDAAATGRSLLATANRYICSTHCAPNQCIRVGTTGLTKCNRCKNNMKPILSGVNMGQCGCPAGTYFDKTAPEVITNDGVGNCIPCEFGYYCNKQLTWVANGELGTTVGRTQCADHLTTRARRSTSVWDCVNKGGYYQNNTATGPVATACTGNTYAIAKSKQSACTPCPAGMQVNETDARDKPTSCKVPPGYFMKSPGQIAPCDQGSYQPLALTADQAAAGSCIACPEGVTTVDKASDALADCNLLKPGYVATALSGGAITTAVLCPQGYYCPGSTAGGSAVAAYVEISELTQANVTDGVFIATVTPKPVDKSTDDALIKPCTKSAWTKNVGATAVDQCMVPPGFDISGGNVAACGTNKYRSDWIALAAASGKPCVACGTDINAEAIEPITLYSLNTTAEAGANTDYSVLSAMVKASSKSCYIEKGQGMYYVSNGTSIMVYKARNCGKGTNPVANSYGVSSAKVYGLAQTPCKLCPAGMKVDDTLTDLNVTDYTKYKTTNGFFDPLACVTVPGYGYDGRVATQCAKGWYNAGNNYLACTQCGYGLTTNAPGQNANTTCKSAPGFGYYNGTDWATGDGKMQQCPAGTYNNETKTPAECTSCPGNSWTEEEGSDAEADCTICKPGYGGPNTGACSACGGDAAAGSYGPPGRDNTELSCVACPTSVIGFQFWYEGNNKNYTSPARAIQGAQDAAECVAGMAQIEDGLWYLAGANAASDPVKTSIQDCADYCLGEQLCMFATFDYNATDDANKCKVKMASNSGTVVTAFKAVPSSDVSQSRKLQAAKPKAVSTGMYTQWLDAGSDIGVRTPPSTDAGDKAACFDACDALDSCAGVVFDNSKNNDPGNVNKKCLLITGATAPDGADVAKRSLTRAKPSLFAI